jgi:unsaturated chondroitin disaccharide hydrolase
MPLQIDVSLTPERIMPAIGRLFELSAEKLSSIVEEYDPSQGSPVYTETGRYTTRGWTEWTQGFLFGSAILQYDATGDEEFLEYGRGHTVRSMAPHLSHTGVHDHGFNNVSTYGNLLRLMNEGRIPEVPWERQFYELALKISGAVQACRWSRTADGGGYIYSFNGPHSLFADTVRSLRALALAHQLGHKLLGEHDAEIPLLGRLIQHARTTAEYSVYYGTGRDAYDTPGRVAHESVFNVNDGRYRCPNSQQGYSPFTTWTRGLAWIMLGFAEQLEFVSSLQSAELGPFGGKDEVCRMMTRVLEATCGFYLENTPTDGIPYWDTGAPGLASMPGYLERPADPFNRHEPVDSSAAAVAAQGLMRFGTYLEDQGDPKGRTFFQAGLEPPYLSEDPEHHGLLLHSVYHRPNGWDYVPAGAAVPYGESSMWGDYHIRETALYVKRLGSGEPYLVFWRRKNLV